MSHAFFIRHCLALAEKGRGHTGINPMVGAVLVRPEGRTRVSSEKRKVNNRGMDSYILAEGFHSEFGHPHAERDLLETYTGDILPTDILYVNLEPCCHLNKKTPPCTDLILKRGIKNVVYGMKDPNPEVSGKGIEYMNKKDVQVSGPFLEQECRRLNRGFVSLMTKNRPWITLKSAQTVDGKIANIDGSPLKITSREQDAWSHEFLRARHDAILVGVGTVISDDPVLTVRPRTPSLASARATPLPSGEGTGVRVPWRIILDPHFRIPLTATVIRPGSIIITDLTPDAEKKKIVEAKGVKVVEVAPSSGAGFLASGAGFLPAVGSHFDWQSLWTALTTPHEDFYGISSILVEGGAKTWDAFRSAKMVDEEVLLLGVYH